MKQILILLVFLVAVLTIRAQDIINTKKSEQIKVKVYEITDYSVKYKPIDDLDGQMQTMDAYNIVSVKFANGVLYKFSDDIRLPEHKEQNDESSDVPEERKKKKNDDSWQTMSKDDNENIPEMNGTDREVEDRQMREYRRQKFDSIIEVKKKQIIEIKDNFINKLKKKEGSN